MSQILIKRLQEEDTLHGIRSLGTLWEFAFRWWRSLPSAVPMNITEGDSSPVSVTKSDESGICYQPKPPRTLAEGKLHILCLQKYPQLRRRESLADLGWSAWHTAGSLPWNDELELRMIANASITDRLYWAAVGTIWRRTFLIGLLPDSVANFLCD